MMYLVRTLVLFFCGFFLFSGAAAGSSGKPLLEFPVHFAVLSSKQDVNRAVDRKTAQREIDILNTYFVTENGEPLARFRFKSFQSYEEIRNSPCEFIRLGDFTGRYRSAYWQDLFNSCNDPKVVDPAAINFYIYDSYSQKRGFSDKDSHGKNNRDRPYVILDWERLGHRIQSPEEHEMGHAFGLEHVCAPGATPRTSTNIMASRDCGLGSGGRRDIGFNPRQTEIILRNAGEIHDKLLENR